MSPAPRGRRLWTSCLPPPICEMGDLHKVLVGLSEADAECWAQSLPLVSAQSVHFLCEAFSFICSFVWLCRSSLRPVGSFVAVHRLSSCGPRLQSVRASLLCGLWELGSLTRNQTCVPCTARQSFTPGPPGKSLKQFINTAA